MNFYDQITSLQRIQVNQTAMLLTGSRHRPPLMGDIDGVLCWYESREPVVITEEVFVEVELSSLIDLLAKLQALVDIVSPAEPS